MRESHSQVNVRVQILSYSQNRRERAKTTEIGPVVLRLLLGAEKAPEGIEAVRTEKLPEVGTMGRIVSAGEDIIVEVKR